ncbi:peptide chain release factor N(5)-glutamine methyltransferase [Candidatus Puniceispirillum sp.]|uniref:peptide chain release factor N(5)-glutamine methyltransferase n=1 Tax=Candidatus Puniceispirillum sp. TaxID=2026719 RepID=UPI003F6A33E5
MMMQDAREILLDIAAILKAASIESPQQDARLLLGAALGRHDAVLPHETIHFGDAEKTHLHALVARRVAREPVSRIRGWREFWSLRFALSSATLDPRPDSEIIVATAIAAAKARRVKNPVKQIKLLDLGTGSGCLLLACLSELPDAFGLGLDISEDALATARNNATALSLAGRSRFHQHSFMDEMSQFGSFDIILCNPPYIPAAEITELEPEVARYEPMWALDGGADGLDCWRGIMTVVPACLAVAGCLVVEIGAGQEDDVIQLAQMADMICVEMHKDLAGITRCLVFALKN